MKFALIYIIALVALFVSAEAKANHDKKQKNHHKKTKNGFCVGKLRSNGKQLKQGSCSTLIQGDIPSSSRMPSILIVSPDNGAKLKANKKFSVDVVLKNIETGHFSDPEKEYYSVPQQLNDHGLILGHTHVTIQKLNGDVPPDAKQFKFFEGLNEKASSKGLLSVDVIGKDGKPGLSAGHYRICTLTSSFSHQPVIMPVAKRGAQDDCIRIKVGEENEKKEETPQKVKTVEPPKKTETPQKTEAPQKEETPKTPY